jgi:tetratricopeptide (TPR) repeat protein
VGVAVNPKNVETSSAADWLAKGIGFYNLNRYDEAIQAYDRALELNPQDPEVWKNKGYTFNKLGKNKEANECFWKAIGLSAGYASDRGHLVNESEIPIYNRIDQDYGGWYVINGWYDQNNSDES